MKKFKQIGQGMTEYIIIVALIAIAGIAAWSFFGQTMQGSVANLSEELSGTDADQATTQGYAADAAAEATTVEDMANYDDNQNSG